MNYRVERRELNIIQRHTTVLFQSRLATNFNWVATGSDVPPRWSLVLKASSARADTWSIRFASLTKLHKELLELHNSLDIIKHNETFRKELTKLFDNH